MYDDGAETMLVICEDCGKKYTIDEHRIKGNKAKFSCNGCGYVIIVEKPPVRVPPAKGTPVFNGGGREPESADDSIQTKQQSKVSNAASGHSPVATGKGMPIRFHFLLTMILGFALVAGAAAYLYLTYIPQIINHQIELRASVITESFGGVIKKPLLLRNYLQVNKEAQRTSKLPGVAYASVVNKKGIVVAGFFSDMSRFDRSFEAQVKEKGFPVSVLTQNELETGGGYKRITVGGQVILDTVLAIPETGGKVHVGIYVSEVDEAIRNTLLSPEAISVVCAIFLIGFFIIFFLTRTITKPLHQLTDIANRISLGELDLTVTPSGPREMRELATAFERMRNSIKAAVDRLAR